MFRLRSALTFMALSVAGFAPPAVLAQGSYPARTITVVVPFPAGGPNDIIARIVTSALQQSLK